MEDIDKDYVDSQQQADLQAHLRSLNDQELKQAYEKTIQDSESDKGFGYTHGATQSSTLRNLATIQTIMEERHIEY